VENLLRQQLRDAIGKEVTPADFAAYMKFHNRKLFKAPFAPTPFCFAVRRSDQHGPEGTVSIEEEVVGDGGDSNISTPIVTIAAHSQSTEPMTFDLSASTSVSFAGERHLHAWLSHQFSGTSGAKLSLVSRARQFSSMLVLVGRIASATSFEPKYAAIVQNKDELSIPLDLSTIPTPKEFKDAIESLSPEQQSFAKAFRAMQLESTLFGVLVVQIKPQLERVLNLPDDSLTKEIKLTQDLMQLFIKYQIPSDLLSFDTTDPAPAAERLAGVKGHVKAMHEMIQLEQAAEIEQRKQEELYKQPLVQTPSFSSYSEAASECSRDVFEEECVLEKAVQMKSADRGGRFFGGAKRMMKSVRSMKESAARPLTPPRGRSSASNSLSVSYAAPIQMDEARCTSLEVEALNEAAPCEAAAKQIASATTEAAASKPAASKPEEPRLEKAPAASGSTCGTRDFTQVPKQMDENFEKLDSDNALRPTIINPGKEWTKKAQRALLASPTTNVLGNDEQKMEKEAAFDLLDALTKSGALALEHASLHVVVAATHCFEHTVTETAVQENVNPIEKVERSTLIMASTVHQQPTSSLINEAQLPRVSAASPTLFIQDEGSLLD